MRYLPIDLDVRGRRALFLGGSAELVSKIDRALAAGAIAAVICEGPPCPEIEARAARGAIALHRRALDPADLEGAAVVFASPFTTPEEEALAHRLAAQARERGLLFCAVDRPEACTFVNAAVAEAPGLVMTFRTGGASPGTARRIREDLERLFADPRFARYMDALARLRASLPRGARAARLSEAVKGFAIEARLLFPAWFEAGAEPPEPPPSRGDP
jgi:precorrin-2 dehydrogenase/sirohydrochlorin ferrochelatase